MVLPRVSAVDRVVAPPRGRDPTVRAPREIPRVVPWLGNTRSPRVGTVPVVTTAAPPGTRPAWAQDGAVAHLRVPGVDGAPPTELRFAAAEGRVAVALVLLGGRRAVDVSIQPGLVATLVGPADAREVGDRLAAFARGQGAWAPSEPTAADLVAVVAGAAFPLLGAALEAGATALAEVPRWAAPVLSAPTARAGAARAFGPRATRPVVAALAAGLVRGVDRGGATGGPPTPTAPDLLPLALGLMAPALAPDRLARVLRAGADTGPGPPPASWPDGEVVDLGRRHTPGWGEHRTERVLLDAAALGDGPSVLAEALCLQALVGHRAPTRLPNRLVPLRDELRSLLPADPNPHGLVAPRRRRSRPVAAEGPARRPPAPTSTISRLGPPGPPVPPPQPTADARRGAMLRAPATRGAAPPEHVPLQHPAAVLVLAGVEVLGATGPLRLVVPRTGAELGAWGARLDNCVGGFAAAVNEGRSVILGVEAADRLAYCIEVRPDGGVRQFLATRNRPVPRGDAAAVLAALAAAGVVHRSAPGNEIWFEEP